MDIFSIGEMLIDFLPGAEEGSYLRNAGGAPANMAIAAARNGLDAGFCGLLGNDGFGRFLARTLRENNVRVLCPRFTDEAVTTMAFVTLEPNGERSFTFARKPGADMLLTVDDVREGDISEAAVIHAGSCSLSGGTEVEATLHAMRRGKKLGKLVSFDVNYRDMIWGGDVRSAVAMIQEALPFVDILKVSEEETSLLGGDLRSIMREYGIALVVETLGAKGARCIRGESAIFAPSPDVPHVADTTGAGDAFLGAFLAGLLRRGIRDAAGITDGAISAALPEGVMAGAMSVQKKGAITSLPTRAQIEAMLGDRG